ncbi:hypothetical protein [Agriterribacter sp.]|uniref:hypothetical protein n=1 Tax=Agriterribacter sp. TaxID=2821509 RepID=UPI002CBA41CE|nr:hypothetical protein [Agriterribacter sp.]HTN08409.1 hypothetical protein [Agriterribacter sp.]
MKKIISFSLWGTEMLYWQGAIENIKIARSLYPGWICRFYVDEKSDKRYIRLLQSQECEIIFKQARGSCSGLVWRFLAADNADIMICRDADSRLSLREVYAVNDWLNSDKDFHIMRDHPLHTSLILGGMWGCRNMEGMNALVENIPYEHQEVKGFDQYYLAKYIYPQIKDAALIHDSYKLFGDGIDFPTKRIENEYVGAVIPV